ncbi:MAG TPA: hypothetical protein VM677_26040, partial [Actinokineospora sp.]|nr:hypothetical protein [Actinokineospora sp.]
AAQSAQAKLDAMVTAGGPASYAGSASLWGFIRGGMNANITFGDSGPFSFSGSMWTSPIAAAGGGAGFWSVIPPNGQEMDFVWTGAALEGGGVALLWSVNGTTLGAMSIFVAGLGIGGGKGSGTWTKG